MINHKQLSVYIKAFRLICVKCDIPQVDLTMCIFIGNETVNYSHIVKHNFTIKFSSMLYRGYIERLEGKGKRFRVSDKGRDVLNQYYQLVDKLSEVKLSKQAIKSTIDLI
jgi:hypothetical protein